MDFIYIRVCCHITLLVVRYILEWERMVEPLVISSNERKRNVPWQKLSWIFCTHERSQRMKRKKRKSENEKEEEREDEKNQRTNERTNSIANEWECSRNNIWQAKCLAVVVVCLFCCVYSVVARVFSMKSWTLFSFIHHMCVCEWVSAFSLPLEIFVHTKYRLVQRFRFLLQMYVPFQLFLF